MLFNAAAEKQFCFIRRRIRRRACAADKTVRISGKLYRTAFYEQYIQFAFLAFFGDSFIFGNLRVIRNRAYIAFCICLLDMDEFPPVFENQFRHARMNHLSVSDDIISAHRKIQNAILRIPHTILTVAAESYNMRGIDIICEKEHLFLAKFC